MDRLSPSPPFASPARERGGDYVAQSIERRDFSPADHSWLTSPKFLPRHRELLLGAQKCGGMLPNGRNTTAPFSYFDAKNFPPCGDYGAGHINFTRGITLEKIADAILVAPDKCPRDEDQFTFSVRQEAYAGLELIFEKGFAFFINLGETWAHFIQDGLHFLVFARDFLRAHPDLPIFLHGTADEPVLRVIKNELGIQNPLIFFPPPIVNPRRYGVRSLYLCRFLPKSHLFSCAPALRRRVNGLLASPSTAKTRLVYLSRKNQKSRRVKNEAELRAFLARQAEEMGLEFVPWESEKYSFEETMGFMRSAKILVAPHGGANMHSYWLSPGTTFVEFVLPRQMETLMSIACSVGLDYWMLPAMDGDHHSEGFTAELPALGEILDQVSG